MVPIPIPILLITGLVAGVVLAVLALAVQIQLAATEELENQPLLADHHSFMVEGVAALHIRVGLLERAAQVLAVTVAIQTQITPLLELLIEVVVGVETLALHHLRQDNQVRLEALA